MERPILGRVEEFSVKKPSQQFKKKKRSRRSIEEEDIQDRDIIIFL
jgi:hypothetical protein